MRLETKMAKLNVLVMALLFVVCCLTGCKADGAVKSEGELPEIVIGIDKYQPYSYLDSDGSYAGIDVELATIVFDRLGYKPEFKLIPWNEKNELLDNGSIDCIWSCYSMNEREELYQWAGPYINSPQVIAVRTDSDIYTFNDLAGKRVGVQATTRASALFLHETYSELPTVYRVNIFSTADDMFAAMRKGYVEAISGHEAVINELVKDGHGEYRLLVESPQVSRAGVAFKKDTHVELTQQINQLFLELTEDGTIAKIVEKYGLNVSFSVIGGSSDEK